MYKPFIVGLLVLALLAGGMAAAQEEITHGPISGEVTATSAVLWARAAEEGTLAFEVFDTPDYEGAPVASAAVEVNEAADFTGEVKVQGLAPGTVYYYRVGTAEGTFATAPASDDAAGFRFTFGAGLGGQGYCRSPETGWTVFETMLEQAPGFFILLGDSVYVDSACPSDEGQNVPGAEGPYSDLEGFRTRYRYHLEDPHYTALLAQTPVFVTWDDHEILDNFSGQTLQSINPALFQEGRQAYFEYWPLMGTDEDPYRMYRAVSYGALADFFILDTRSYRDPIVNWDTSPVTGEPKTMLGAEQFAWLQEALAGSAAMWKFIVSSVPLSYPTGWPQPEVDGRDGWANGSDRSGYETELMALLYFIESHDLENVVFLTGDIHWPAAISYDPDRDGAADFYEFSASPMSSIPLNPADPDLTFNPTVLYAEGEFMGDHFNFGEVQVSEDGPLTFRVIQYNGSELFAVEVAPE